MGSIEFLLLRAVSVFFNLLEWLIFARILLSWFPINHNNPISQLIFQLTEPVLGPARRLMDKSPLGGGMMLDFSPIIALILMRLVQTVLINLIGMI